MWCEVKDERSEGEIASEVVQKITKQRENVSCTNTQPHPTLSTLKKEDNIFNILKKFWKVLSQQKSKEKVLQRKSLQIDIYHNV